MNSLAKENMNIAVESLKKISETDLADLCNITEQAINAGGGFGSHAATKRANYEMVQSLLGDDLTNVNFEQMDGENLLINFLEDTENWEKTSGVHLQTGLRFKILMLDTHINARYNLAKDIYTDKAGWLQLMFKMGFAI